MSDVYRFGYEWRIHGPIDTVFYYVSDARTFLDWFPVFKDVRPDDPIAALHVGSHTLARVRALLPYVLDWDITVSRYEPPRFIDTFVKLTLNGRFGMHGSVSYAFQPSPGDVVLVTNQQEMYADKPLPRVLHPLLQAAFAFNHDWAMRKAQAPLQAIVRRGSAGRAVVAPG